MIRRLAVLVAVCAGGALTLSSPAAAHIDPEPTQAQAGSTLSDALVWTQCN